MLCCACDTVTCHSLAERDQNNYEADKVQNKIVNGIPHYPIPKYSDTGGIQFFPSKWKKNYFIVNCFGKSF